MAHAHLFQELVSIGLVFLKQYFDTLFENFCPARSPKRPYLDCLCFSKSNCFDLQAQTP